MNNFTKQDKIDFIRKKISSNVEWSVRGMLRIYESQTSDEQTNGETIEQNGVGFSGIDAKILSSICQFYNNRGFISDKQAAIVLKKMKKYAIQLLSISDEQKLEKAMNKE